MKKGKTDQMYDVNYYNKNGRLIETIKYAVPIALAKSIKRDKGNTTHRMGIIKLEKNN